MNLTDDIEVRIKTLFDKIVSDRKQGDYLLSIIDKQIDTYYEDPKHPGQAYYSFIDVKTVESMTGYLEQFWTELSNIEFMAYAAQISEIAFMLSTGYEAQSEDVSSFVYTMY